MKKLIFGIAAVFCVQICFQALMSVNLIDADYAVLETPSNVEHPASTLATVDPTDLRVIAERPIAAKRTAPVVELQQRSTELAKSWRRATPQDTANAAFKPVIITYNRPTPTAEKALFSNGQKASQPKSEPQKVDEKSFLAKALPVIKKPYDWLKAVGSKLR